MYNTISTQLSNMEIKQIERKKEKIERGKRTREREKKHILFVSMLN